MSNSTQSRRKRLHSLADSMALVLKHGHTTCFVNAENPADLRALLASERELRRINAAMRKALRHLQCVQARDADSAIILQTAFLELMKKRIKL